MGIISALRHLRPLIGLIALSCSSGAGPGAPKEDVKFGSSIDGQGITPVEPIKTPEVEVAAQDAVIKADPEEVKNEIPENVPAADEKPLGGTTGENPAPPAPPVPAPTPPDPVPPAPKPLPFYPAQCAAIKKAQPTAPSGNYKIYLKGVATAPIDAYCDMSEDGGGWTLILNYVHKGGTNPALTVRAADLPLLVSDTLGVDESIDTKAWGHASNALLSDFAPKELRFYCSSLRVSRVMHFKTSDATCLNAATTGLGSCLGVRNSFTPLSGHTANSPANADLARSDRGDFALTNDVFSSNTLTYDQGWSIKGDSLGDSWECDYGTNSNENSTIHRIFFR